MEEFLVKVANSKSEEENVVEADWVNEQQGVEGRLLVQLAIPGVGRFWSLYITGMAGHT